MKNIKLEVIFPISSISTNKIWNFIYSSEIIKDKYVFVVDSKVNKDSVNDYLKNNNLYHFEIACDNLVITYNTLVQRSHVVFDIEIIKGFDFEKCNKFIVDIYKTFGFVLARIYNVQFNYWQNAKNIEQYKRVGKKISHLKFKSNGLPPPLGKKIIDTSKNPGRRVIKDGYVEFVSSHMWVGKEIWQILGFNNEEKLCNLNQGITVKKEFDLISISLSSILYTEEHYEPEKLNILRKAIFKKY